MTSPNAPELPAARLSRRQLQFLFAVDRSGSMTGDKIASLNYAIRSAIPEMREAATDNPETDVVVRVLSFADGVEWIVRDPVPVGAFEWTDLAAGGETDMGAAFAALADVLTPAAMPGRQLPPVVVLMSDGMPTDDAERGLAALMQSPYGATALRLAIAIGSDADKPLLQSFIGNPDIRPLQANSAETLVHRIKWAASVPVKAASSPIGAGDPTRALAAGVATENETAGDLVW